MSPGVILVAALLAPIPAASPPVEKALAGAARYCETVVTDRRTTPPLPAGATVPSDSGVPELIKRFAATRPMTRMFGVDSYTRFHARNGQVWVVLSQQGVACDIVVTAVPGGSAALGDPFTRLLAGQGWESLGSIPATATNPLWRHRLVKRLPKPGSPNSGLRLNIQGLRPFPGDEEGVQMELSFMAFDKFQSGVGAPPR